MPYFRFPAGNANRNKKRRKITRQDVSFYRIWSIFMCCVFMEIHGVQAVI